MRRHADVRKLAPAPVDSQTIVAAPVSAYSRSTYGRLFAPPTAGYDVAVSKLAFLGTGTWIQMSTIGISGIERCAELADRMGVTLVDAPVLGTREPAEKGRLVILAGGPGSARAICEPIFEELGSRTIWLGAGGAATRCKV